MLVAVIFLKASSFCWVLFVIFMLVLVSNTKRWIQDYWVVCMSAECFRVRGVWVYMCMRGSQHGRSAGESSKETYKVNPCRAILSPPSCGSHSAWVQPTLYQLKPILCRKRPDVTMLLHFQVICVYVFLRYFQTVVISYSGRTRQVILQTFSK